jgi:hypothetical protein
MAVISQIHRMTWILGAEGVSGFVKQWEGVAAWEKFGK